MTVRTGPVKSTILVDLISWVDPRSISVLARLFTMWQASRSVRHPHHTSRTLGVLRTLLLTLVIPRLSMEALGLVTLIPRLYMLAKMDHSLKELIPRLSMLKKTPLLKHLQSLIHLEVIYVSIVDPVIERLPLLLLHVARIMAKLVRVVPMKSKR